MTGPRIAIIYDDSLRPDTTGGYCLRALRQLAQVTHFGPDPADAVGTGFDLYLRIDDDLDFRLRPEMHPAFFWAIDTHRSLARLAEQARSYDLVFAAQKEGAERLLSAGIAGCEWLPLACDPEVHRRLTVDPEYDVAFIGHVFPGPRQELLEQVLRHFPRSFIGQVPHTEMCEAYSRARIVINCSLNNDLNMRVFEALSCGALLITDRLTANGQEELFQDRVHLVEYESQKEALDLIGYYLSHEDERRAIAEAGHQEVIARHTYRHRMERVLERFRSGEWPHVDQMHPASVASGRASLAGRNPCYYRWPRPEVMELIPRQARRVLDVGCAAGTLGQEIKRRQQCEVVGIELDAAAAAEACRRLDHLIEGDVETLDLASLGRFDAIVCADVLEHLRDPGVVLRKLRELMAEGGVLVASIPNARHMEVVQQLIEGNWTYQPEGVLDRDHLRFFTRRSAEQLLEEAGFEVVEVRPVKAGGYAGWEQAGRPGDITAGRLRISGLPAGEAEEFFVGQWLVIARPAPRTDWGLTSIIILTWNQFEYTRLCLDSIRRHTHAPYELIIVDNGSTDGTRQWLESFPDIKLIANRENLGFPRGANQGIRAASGDNILLLNNDAVVTPGWLRRLLLHLHSASDVGIVGPLTNYAVGRQLIEVPYRSLAELDGFAWELGKQRRGESAGTGMIVGFCLLTRRDVLDRIGLLDEAFGMGTFEDTDLCFRAVRAGYRLLVCRDAFVHHFGSRTIAGNEVHVEQLLEENRGRFERKWGLATGSPSRTTATLKLEPPQANHRSGLRPPDGGKRGRRRTRSKRGGSGTGAPTVSLCMIARDEEAHIADCLNSVRPYVDEMVVVDTGSHDRTAEIARSFGAKVIESPWQDSFSAARNISIDHATSDWIFWMDADDVLPPESGEVLRRSVSDAPKEVLGFVARVRCPPGPGQYGETVVDHVKLFRNRPEVRFEFRIHEQALPSIRRAGGDISRSEIEVIHQHYDFSPSGQRRKRERDRSLLEMDLREHPDHPFVHFNVGMTAVHEKDYQRAVRHLERSIELAEPGESHVRKAYALLASAHRAREEQSEAVEVCLRGRSTYPDDPELLFNQALAYQALEKPEQAVAAWRELLSLPRNQQYLASVDKGIGSYKAWHNLGIVYDDIGQLAEARSCWERAVAESPAFLPSWMVLLDSLAGEGNAGEVRRLVDRARRTAGAVAADLLEGRRALLRGDPAAAEPLLRRVVESAPDLDLGHRYLSHALLQQGERSAVAGVLRRLIELAPDDAEAHHNLGCLLLDLGRAEEARSHLQLAVKLHPDYAPSQQMLRQALTRAGAEG
jgi:GT2 family glycosyltransferase/tetratricopeptide (TPR) repeat protein/2-polyprenyl-3-methyl-5-hydroxy-6-metoxy-1,4-benzoquinol methylase